MELDDVAMDRRRGVGLWPLCATAMPTQEKNRQEVTGFGRSELDHGSAMAAVAAALGARETEEARGWAEWWRRAFAELGCPL